MGKLEFDLLFLHDDPLDELSQICVDGEGHKFRLYDENRILPSRFLFQVHQQLKENHTNAGNKISEPRPIMENISEYRRFLDTRDATCRKITQLTKPLKNRNGSEEFFNIYESYLWRPNSLEGPAYGRKLPGVEKKSLNEVYLPQVLPLSDRSKSSILASSDYRINSQLEEEYEAEGKFTKGPPRACSKNEQKEEAEKEAAS
ncbi:unnamed protein product [Hymenolepis diminuta]|uniref:Uncharacterized protein n=1 Tax=Hymenolepis diminuta TaxID=6216 RepID=A0A0R3SF38_HYMDI|nr:unnamed protein product [Hymenolepis diminuta]